MSTHNYTPGPIKEHEFEGWSRDPASMSVRDRARLINWACDHWHEVQRNSKNARLIAQVPAFVDTVRILAGHVEEMGCTCTSEQSMESNTGHGKGCMGIAYAKEARALLAVIENGKD